MAKKRTKTPAERAYAKQLKRIKQFISRAEKRGFIFYDNVIPERPTRITQASARKLAKLTPEKLYKKAEYAGEASYGEIVPASEGVKLERSLRAKKAAETRKRKKEQNVRQQPAQESTNTPGFEPPYKPTNDANFYEMTVISNWYSSLENFRGGEAYNMLRVFMGSVIRENGIPDTVTMLEEAANDGVLLTWETVYKGDQALMYIGYLIDFLPESGVLYKDETLDRMQFMSRLGDALEQEEDWEYPI